MKNILPNILLGKKTTLLILMQCDCQLKYNLVKQLLKKYDFRNTEGDETQTTCEQTSTDNQTFIIGYSVKKVHMS